MQTELMAKLANLTEPKRPQDELGFSLAPNIESNDALVNLISKSKNIVKYC